MWPRASPCQSPDLPILGQPPPGAMSVLTKPLSGPPPWDPGCLRAHEGRARARRGLAGVPAPSQGHGCRRSRYCGSGFSLTYFWMYQHVRWAFRSSSTTKSRAALARCLAMPRPR